MSLIQGDPRGEAPFHNVRSRQACKVQSFARGSRRAVREQAGAAVASRSEHAAILPASALAAAVMRAAAAATWALPRGAFSAQAMASSYPLSVKVRVRRSGRDSG